ncbi:MAG: hypothetical protein PHQ74_00745 [Crocinitomicaceae bacterium]|nr:hypothetical protein [Crocinitomicaceae bacterium]
MILKYSIGADDFLNFQLFTASESPVVKRRRLKSKLAFAILYIAFGLFFVVDSKWVYASTFFVLAILWFFFYPLREKRMYERNYKNFILENYRNRFDKEATMEITNAYIQTKDGVNKGKALLSEVSEIVEMPTAIYLRLNTAQTFMLPYDRIEFLESSDVKNTQEMILKFKEIANLNQLKYTDLTNWKWK